MKKTVLETTLNVASDQAQLARTVQAAFENGFQHIFSPYPLAWRANNQLHYDVTNAGEYSWINSKGMEIVVLLLSGHNCRGYNVCEFDIGIALSG